LDEGGCFASEHALYCIELAAAENTLFAFEPIKRIVPITTIKITASMTAY